MKRFLFDITLIFAFCLTIFPKMDYHTSVALSVALGTIGGIYLGIRYTGPLAVWLVTEKDW